MLVEQLRSGTELPAAEVGIGEREQQIGILAVFSVRLERTERLAELAQRIRDGAQKHITLRIGRCRLDGVAPLDQGRTKLPLLRNW